MPYTIDNPPETIKGIPKKAQEIFIAAFNSAYEQYKGDEEKTNATAWAAVKTKFEQDKDGKWVAKESKKELLKGKYEELIQEYGRKNAIADAKRIHSIIQMCQELLDPLEEEIDSEREKKVDEAVKEVDTAMSYLNSLVPMKPEDGELYPKEAYAHVPYTNKPATWQLRLWENSTKKITKNQLSKVSAYLSPGGYKGVVPEIDSNLIPGVKRAVRTAYRNLDINESEMPKWVQEESMSRTLIHDYIPLTEANIGGKGTAKIVVIKPGSNTSGERFYPQEMLARDYKVFEGVKMYADHPTDAEEKARPERSVKDWVATLKNVHVAEGGIIKGDAVIVEPWLMERLATLRNNNLLGEMGVSINAIGSASKGEIEGKKTNIVERIIKARSVDFVTEPGAGGGVELYESDNSLDIDLVTLDTLKEHRPELIKEIQTQSKAEIIKEVKRMSELEEKVKALETANATLTQERDELKVKNEEAVKAKAIAETKAKLDEALVKSDLPQPAKDRILNQFKDSVTDAGITEAIKAEVNYIASIKESGKVKGMGESGKEVTVTIEEQKLSWKRLHPEWTESQIETAIKGY